MTALPRHAEPVSHGPQPPERPRTNAEIDELLTHRMPLIRLAARSVCAHRMDELTSEVICLWFQRYRKNSLKWWNVLSDPNPAYVYRNCRQMALRVVEKWQRHEREEELTEAGERPEWGAADTERHFAGGAGVRAEGNHIASDDEVRRLFATIEWLTGGRVEGTDLWDVFSRARGDTKHTVRRIASGESREEIGRTAYAAARKCLQGALI